MLLVTDRERSEAVAEEVAAAGVALVERLRVDAVQLVETARELPEQRLDDHVVVVWHQAEDVARPVGAAHDLPEHGEEEAAVIVVARDRAARDAAGGDVVDALGGKDVPR
jgi:hypothetical protein